MKSFCLSRVSVIAFAVMVCVGCTRSSTSPPITQNQLTYQNEQPRVSGAWVGTWGISGKDAQGMQHLLPSSISRIHHCTCWARKTGIIVEIPKHGMGICELS